MSANQLTFFPCSAASSVASPCSNKETMSHSSLLFQLTCEPIKSMACCKWNQLQETSENHLRALELGQWDVLGKDMRFSSRPKYA